MEVWVSAKKQCREVGRKEEEKNVERKGRERQVEGFRPTESRIYTLGLGLGKMLLGPMSSNVCDKTILSFKPLNFMRTRINLERQNPKR